MREINEQMNPNQTARAKFKQRLAGGAVLLVVLAIFLPFIFNHSRVNNATLPDTGASAPTTTSTPVAVGSTPPANTNSTTAAATTAAPASQPDALQNSAVVAQPGVAQVDNSLSSDQAGLTLPQSEVAQNPSTPAAAPQTQAQTQSEATASPSPEAQVKTELPKPRATRVQPHTAAVPAANHVAVTKVQPVATGNWIIQAGSFRQPASARKLVEQLHARGLPAYTQVQPNHFVRVYVGPFNNQQQVVKAQRQIQADFRLNGLVTKKHS